MNLSQDEINALLSGNAPAESDSQPDVEDAPPDAEMFDSLPDEEVLPEVEMPSEDVPFLIGGEEDDLNDLFARISEEPALTGVEPADGDYVPEPIEGMLTTEEIDILGEVGNISMGAVATTMYKLLDRRVNITTPRVSVYSSKDVLSLYKIPFVVVTVRYVEGITGNNLLVLKVPDAALITNLLMGEEGPLEEPIELNELHLSAMSEIMNQIMGASSTNLSKLLATPINISTPKSANVGIDSDISEMLEGSDLVVKISFDMEIEGLLNSELLQLIPYDLSRQLAQKFLETMMNETAGASAAASEPAQQTPPPAPPPVQQQEQYPQQQPYPQEQYPQQPYPQQPYQQPYAQQPYPQQPYPQQQQYPQQPYPQQPYAQPYQQQHSLVDVHPMQFQSFDSQGGPPGATAGIGLVRDIPLQVTVELGKTKKDISEILEFNTGTVIELDKIAGDPVEIVVNGKLIARGEVVIIEENYGVRITDIVSA